MILPDIRGLYRFYEELALRFAERGTPRSRSTTSAGPPGSRSAATTSSGSRTSSRRRSEGVQADTGAAVAWLRDAGCSSVFTVGFCFGGRHSWLAAAGGHGLRGAIGFYGRPGPGQDGSPGPTQRADELEAPILGLMGGDDPGIPVEDVREFERALVEAGVDHELVDLRRRPAQLLRPQVRGVRGRIGGRLAPRPRVRRSLALR